ncbi:MAG: 2-hydroxyacyl-CoA dehydratase [Lentisphaerae bacterium]|jgi:benzoyl-CoA reductase/2-hydroxyglutaryl-CoA dehydratase subunit BcrC/BadD/HgdB|nr:2-hydroxyacyl-CoA dehydratase [Lentisphaerota bacterium]
MKDCGLDWFEEMVEHCYQKATEFHEAGTPIIGILCEYTPRELILAAGAWPVCLCGGDADMIPAAETLLPAGICPLIKSTFGYSLNQANPFLEMASLLVAETTCDGKKKMYERLAERHPMHVLELPQKTGDPDARIHWIRELQKLRTVLEERFNVAITDERLRDAIRLMNRERRLRRALAQEMRSATPPLSGRELLDLKSLIACLPDDLAAYERIAGALPGRPADARPSPDNVRVLLTGVPVPHGAERILDLLEADHATVVCQENCTGIKPVTEEVDAEADDPLTALADVYLHLPCSVMTPNSERMRRLGELAREYRAECVVELIWHGCLTYDIEAAYTRELAAQFGLPYLRIETDYSPNDDARIALRLGALYETVRAARR